MNVLLFRVINVVRVRSADTGQCFHTPCTKDGIIVHLHDDKFHPTIHNYLKTQNFVFNQFVLQIQTIQLQSLLSNKNKKIIINNYDEMLF